MCESTRLWDEQQLPTEFLSTFAFWVHSGDIYMRSLCSCKCLIAYSASCVTSEMNVPFVSVDGPHVLRRKILTHDSESGKFRGGRKNSAKSYRTRIV